MTSFELIYEADEDVLEVTFDVVDENFSRAITLNQEIVLHTDSQIANAWGLTFYSYGSLLKVTETHLHELVPLDEPNRNRILALIARPPISHFLELLDTDELRALVKAPRISDLI
jgi:hypothetical protein